MGAGRPPARCGRGADRARRLRRRVCRTRRTRDLLRLLPQVARELAPARQRGRQPLVRMPRVLRAVPATSDLLNRAFPTIRFRIARLTSSSPVSRHGPNSKEPQSPLRVQLAPLNLGSCANRGRAASAAVSSCPTALPSQTGCVPTSMRASRKSPARPCPAACHIQTVLCGQVSSFSTA